MRRIAALILALVLASGLAAPAGSQGTDGDRSVMQSIIASQIDAFRQDNGPAAYDFASPAIRSLFPTVDAFMGMVKSGYPPVYRPQSFTFGPVLDTARGPVQRVFITGPDGVSYVAEYLFQQQPDGTWKINGVSLVKDTSPTI
jgi:hypothetical protein